MHPVGNCKNTSRFQIADRRLDRRSRSNDDCEGKDYCGVPTSGSGDSETENSISSSSQQALLALIKKSMSDLDVIIFEDYDKGF